MAGEMKEADKTVSKSRNNFEKRRLFILSCSAALQNLTICCFSFGLLLGLSIEPMLHLKPWVQRGWETWSHKARSTESWWNLGLMASQWAFCTSPIQAGTAEFLEHIFLLLPKNSSQTVLWVTAACSELRWIPCCAALQYAWCLWGWHDF